MPLILSGSVDISGSMTATTIVVSSPGAAGMVSSSAQITELVPLMAYTASLKSVAMVSSSQQIQNYNLFAVTSSANTFYGNQGISGSLDVIGTAGNGIKLRHSNGTNIAEINELSGVQGAGLALKNSSGTQNILLNAGGDSYINGGNLGIGASTFLNSVNTQFSNGSGASSTNAIGIFNTATSPTSTAKNTIGIGFLSGTSNYVATNTVLGTIDFLGQANDAGYGGASFQAIVTSGGNVGRGTGHSVDLVLSTKPSNSTGTSERVRITNDGYLRLAGAGIQFNGDTAAANSLDDYEEGTFTPTLRFGGNSVGITYSEQSGTYTKIGRHVTISLRIILTNKGSSTGAASIGSLPFNVANITGNFGGFALTFADAMSSFSETVMFVADTNSNYINLRYINGSNYVNFSDSNFTNPSNIIITGTYQAS
jgi:hypothetical protein